MRFVFSCSHKVTIGGLNSAHPTRNQSWRANSYLSITKGTELWSQRSYLKHENSRVGHSQVDLSTFPVLGWVQPDPIHLQPAGNLQELEIWFCWCLSTDRTKNEKRKARRFGFPVSINLRLSNFSWEIKRCFITNNGATWSEDTQPPIHYHPKSNS